MSPTLNTPNQEPDLAATLDQLVAVDAVQANCMFQLAIMLARISLEPCAENYKDETAQSILGLIRNKPKSNVIPLFGLQAPEERSSTRQTLSR